MSTAKFSARGEGGGGEGGGVNLYKFNLHVT